MTTWYDLFETPLGWVGILANSAGLRRTTLPRPTPDECFALLGPEAEYADVDAGSLRGLRTDILRLLHGSPVAFDGYAVDFEDASPFHRAAWMACRSIPMGETRSYAWLAERAGRPGASRAAGQSMARNRLPLVIPCHRVIASDGGMGGFGNGATELGLKRWLLDLESRHQPTSPAS